MKEYFSLDQKDRQHAIEIIEKTLSKRKDVVFAFLFESFLDSPSFRDIDIGVYVDAVAEKEVFDREVDVARLISKAIGKPLDIIEIKILNFAPKSFLNNIFSRGRLLFSKNGRLLASLVEDTSLEALANEHLARQSLKELIPT